MNSTTIPPSIGNPGPTGGLFVGAGGDCPNINAEHNSVVIVKKYLFIKNLIGVKVKKKNQQQNF